MSYRVILVNRDMGTGVGNMPVAVNGRSGKLYGHAFVKPERGGPCFEMSLEDYDRDKFDLIGNPAFRCQWVPCFERNNSLDEHRKLVQRAKEAGVYKRNMKTSEMKEALGDPQ